MLNSEAWKFITDALIRVKPTTEKDREIYEEIKNRPVLTQNPSAVFPDDGENKRRRGVKRSVLGNGKLMAGHRKRSKNNFHEEEDVCSANTCLKPYSL